MYSLPATISLILLQPRHERHPPFTAHPLLLDMRPQQFQNLTALPPSWDRAVRRLEGADRLCPLARARVRRQLLFLLLF